MKTVVNIFRSSLIVAVAILSTAAVSYVFAAPTQPPSSGAGVDLPLHIGSAGQTKAGALTVGGTLTASGNLNVGSTLSVPTLCLNGACSSSWPSASVTPTTATGSHNHYFGNYTVYNNGYEFTVSGTTTLSGSGSLISASLDGGCPCIWGYQCPISSDISVQITNFTNRTVSYAGTCKYNNGWFNATANINFIGITI